MTLLQFVYEGLSREADSQRSMFIVISDSVRLLHYFLNSGVTPDDAWAPKMNLYELLEPTTVIWATNQPSDRRLGDKPSGRMGDMLRSFGRY